jgi:hypothetical protein
MRYGRWLWVIVAGLGINSGLAHAQDDQLVAESDIEKNFNIQARSRLKKLVQGEAAPAGPEDDRVMEWASKYFLYSLTFTGLAFKTPDKGFHRYRQEFESEMKLAAQNKDKNQAFRAKFAQALMARFKDVLDRSFDSNRQAALNAALMLPSFVLLQEDRIGDFLASILLDPKQSPAIKMYAARALGDFFDFFPIKEETVINKMKKERRDALVKRVDALIGFIGRPFDPKAEDEPAFHFIRREAIKALGKARAPAVSVDAKKGEVHGKIAETLLAVLDPKPRLNPPPTTQEKLEAAIGICQIQIDANSDYLPELGIYRAGMAMVEFLKEYQKDRPQFIGGGRLRQPPEMPWKVAAKRIQQAIEDLGNSLKGNAALQDARKKAEKLNAAFQPLLEVIVRSYGSMDNLGPVVNEINTLQPMTNRFFKTIKSEG